MESEREGQAVFPCRFSHTHAHLHGLLGGYLYSNYRLFAYCIYNSTDRRVFFFFFFRAHLFSGLCLRRKKWAAVRSSGQNRVQRVEIKMRNDAQERETTEAWGPVGRKRGRSTKKGECLAL